MLATVPAGPKTSYKALFGFNCTIASALPASGPADATQNPSSHETVKAPTSTTTTITTWIHDRLTTLVIGICTTPWFLDFW
jgi:hypothetical protein